MSMGFIVSAFATSLFKKRKIEKMSRQQSSGNLVENEKWPRHSQMALKICT